LIYKKVLAKLNRTTVEGKKEFKYLSLNIDKADKEDYIDL